MGDQARAPFPDRGDDALPFKRVRDIRPREDHGLHRVERVQLAEQRGHVIGCHHRTSSLPAMSRRCVTRGRPAIRA